VENAFFLQVEIPKDEETTCITDCLERYSDPVAVDWRCTTCGKTDATTKSLHITKLAPYTFINIVRGIQDNYGNHRKNMARVTLPVSSRMELATKEGSVPFQLIADMTHHGPT
jgi:ubiquitin C-terminal hydrolase